MDDELNMDRERETAEAGVAPEPPEAAGGDADGGHAAELAAAQREEVEALKAQAAEYLNGWQRARAEFANYKRRIEKEQSEAYQNATARVIGRFLDVADDFDRAMQERPADFQDEAAARWSAGLDLIHRKLHNLLEAEGVRPIEAEGQPFDPLQHEAVTHEDSDAHAPGTVIGVVRQGYRIGDRVIRPAMVRVAR
jgi:molecular chaperone GrpE